MSRAPYEEFPDEYARTKAEAAMEVAKQALGEIEKHRAVCDQIAKTDFEWRGQIANSLQRIESSISVKVGQVYSRLWWAGGALAGAMFTVILLLAGILLKAGNP